MIIVTRHPALVKVLKEDYNITGTVLEHVTREDIIDQDVVGVLPLSLACLTNSITEIPLNLLQNLRGKELSVEEVRQYSGKLRTYKVLPSWTWNELFPKQNILDPDL